MATPCGQKKIDAARRKGLGAAIRKYEEFRQKTVQRFDSMYFVQAVNHTSGRNQAVAHLLSCLSLMRNLGDIPRPQPVLTWSKAQVFTVTGSAEENAAHCLPCQLWVDNVKPWDLVRSQLVDRSRIAEMLRVEIFGHETILPLAFNLADSLSEDNCLRGALLAACAHVIAHTKPLQRRSGVLKRSGDGTILLTINDRPEAATAGIDHQAVKDAYRLWQNNAAEAYREAGWEAGQGVFREEKDYTADVLYLLEKYEESLINLPARISDDWMWRFENEVWV